MKIKKVESKLTLGKRTITNLSDHEMNDLKAGSDYTYYTCVPLTSPTTTAMTITVTVKSMGC